MKCRICGEEKEQSAFYFRTDSNKYRTECIECSTKVWLACRARNPEKYKAKSKQWVAEHREQFNATSNRWSKNNPEKRRAIAKKNYEKHKDAKIAYQNKWVKNNPDKVKAIRTREHEKNKERYKTYSREYCSERYHSDPSYKVKVLMSSAVNASLRAGGKGGKSWRLLLGYGVPELKKHLEKQFKDGMTWDNYGHGWHIDHIIPISAFNITSYEDYDFKRCWSLKNLQPLWKEENYKKHNTLERPFQPALNMGMI